MGYIKSILQAFFIREEKIKYKIDKVRIKCYAFICVVALETSLKIMPPFFFRYLLFPYEHRNLGLYGTDFF